MFKQAATHNNHIDNEELTDTVFSYIRKCTDDVTHTKTIITRANKKPWLTGAGPETKPSEPGIELA